MCVKIDALLTFNLGDHLVCIVRLLDQKSETMTKICRNEVLPRYELVSIIMLSAERKKKTNNINKHGFQRTINDTIKKAQ